MNWLTAVLCLILLLYMWNGYRLGFIRMVFSIFTIIVATVTASWVSPKLCNIVCQNRKFVQMVETYTLSLKDGRQTESKSEQKKSIDQMKLPQVIQNALNENNNDEIYQMFGVSVFEQYIARYLAMLIVKILVYILVFAATYILLHVLCRLLDVISHLPVLNGFNKTVGILIGLLKGIIVVDLIMAATLIFQNTRIGQSVMGQILESPVLSWIYEHNFILRIVMNLEGLFLHR